AAHLTIDPALDGGIAAARDLLPVVVRDGLVPLDDTHVSHLGRSPVVRPVMEAEEHLSSHRLSSPVGRNLVRGRTGPARPRLIALAGHAAPPRAACRSAQSEDPPY